MIFVPWSLNSKVQTACKQKWAWAFFLPALDRTLCPLWPNHTAFPHLKSAIDWPPLPPKKSALFFNWWKIFLRTCFLKTFWIFIVVISGFCLFCHVPHHTHRDILHSLGWFLSSLWFSCLNLLSTKIAGMYYCVTEKLCHPPTSRSKFPCFLMLPPLSNISLPFLWNTLCFATPCLFCYSMSVWQPSGILSQKYL